MPPLWTSMRPHSGGTNFGVVAERLKGLGGAVRVTPETEAEIVRLYHAEGWKKAQLLRN